MSASDCYVNAGVYVVDLERYALRRIGARISELVALHAVRRLWWQGVQQPSFVLALAGHTVTLDARWNADGLGYNPRKGRIHPCTLQSAYVLHWNGAYKPWACAARSASHGGHDTPGTRPCYAEYWLPHRLEAAPAA